LLRASQADARQSVSRTQRQLRRHSATLFLEPVNSSAKAASNRLTRALRAFTIAAASDSEACADLWWGVRVPGMLNRKEEMWK